MTALLVCSSPEQYNPVSFFVMNFHRKNTEAKSKAHFCSEEKNVLAEAEQDYRNKVSNQNSN